VHVTEDAAKYDEYALEDARIVCESKPENDMDLHIESAVWSDTPSAHTYPKVPPTSVTTKPLARSFEGDEGDEAVLTKENDARGVKSPVVLPSRNVPQVICTPSVTPQLFEVEYEQELG